MKLLPDFTLPDEPVRPGVAWDLGHLRPSLWATAALAAIGVVLALIFGDARSVWGVLLGFAIVALFFTLSSWAVAFAGRYDDRLTMPAALGSYLIKIGLLGVLLISIPIDGPIDVRALAASVVAGVVLWSVTQILYVVRKRQFYVDYHPPAPKDYDQ